MQKKYGSMYRRREDICFIKEVSRSRSGDEKNLNGARLNNSVSTASTMR